MQVIEHAQVSVFFHSIFWIYQMVDHNRRVLLPARPGALEAAAAPAHVWAGVPILWS
jgi:hypothetical protein